MAKRPKFIRCDGSPEHFDPGLTEDEEQFHAAVRRRMYAERLLWTLYMANKTTLLHFGSGVWKEVREFLDTGHPPEGYVPSEIPPLSSADKAPTAPKGQR